MNKWVARPRLDDPAALRIWSAWSAAADSRGRLTMRARIASAANAQDCRAGFQDAFGPSAKECEIAMGVARNTIIDLLFSEIALSELSLWDGHIRVVAEAIQDVGLS